MASRSRRVQRSVSVPTAHIHVRVKFPNEHAHHVQRADVGRHQQRRGVVAAAARVHRRPRRTQRVRRVRQPGRRRRRQQRLRDAAAARALRVQNATHKLRARSRSRLRGGRSQ